MSIERRQPSDIITGFLQRWWAYLLLLGAITGLFAYSLQLGDWVDDSGPLVSAVMLGMLVGVLLAGARLPGWFALLWTLAVSLFTLGEAVGHFLPGWAALTSQPFWEILTSTHLHLDLLLVRIGGWARLYSAGQNIQDTGLFVFFIGLLVWGANVWLGWAVLRLKRALFGLLPYGLLLAVNVTLAGQGSQYFFMFLVLSVLLLALTSASERLADWNRRRLDYPDLDSEWGSSAFIIAIAIGLCAWLVPLFTTAEGWKALSDVVNRARQQTNQTAEQVFAAVRSPRVEDTAESVETPNMSSIGRPLPSGKQVVMRIRTSDPLPPPHQSGMNVLAVKHYWRSMAYTTYTGTGWLPLTTGIVAPSFDPQTGPPAGRYTLSQNFQILAQHDSSLFAVNMPVSGSQGTDVRVAFNGDSGLVNGDVSEYTVISWATRVSSTALQAAGSDYPPEVRSVYLQLPSGLPSRASDLARRITAGAGNAYDKALRIQEYLRTTYSYDLDVPPAPEGRDVTDYFLFEAPGGFCSYFATAMAVMARAVDVPARVVTGYATGQYDEQSGLYVVTADMSHAWVEVYFPGYGWVEFEPTPARSPFTYAAEAGVGSLEVTGAPEQMLTQSEEDRLLGVKYLAALGFIILALAGLRAMGASDDIRRASLRVRILRHYARMQAWFAMVGLRSTPSTTPDEFDALLGIELKDKTRLLHAAQAVNDLYRRTLFSPRLPTEDELRQAGRLWLRALWQFLRLWAGKGR